MATATTTTPTTMPTITPADGPDAPLPPPVALLLTHDCSSGELELHADRHAHEHVVHGAPADGDALGDDPTTADRDTAGDVVAVALTAVFPEPVFDPALDPTPVPEPEPEPPVGGDDGSGDDVGVSDDDGVWDSDAVLDGGANVPLMPSWNRMPAVVVAELCTSTATTFVPVTSMLSVETV